MSLENIFTSEYVHEHSGPVLAFITKYDDKWIFWVGKQGFSVHYCPQCNLDLRNNTIYSKNLIYQFQTDIKRKIANDFYFKGIYDFTVSYDRALFYTRDYNRDYKLMG